MRNIIDAHIHFDLYEEEEQKTIIESMSENQISGLISVSQHLESAKKNLALGRKYEHVYPAFGFHPEQPLLTEEEMRRLFDFISKHQNEMIAIGEVGLPYYLRKEEKNIKLEPYVEVLEQFIILAKRFNKPILLHAVYDDAPIVCELLEKHSIQKAHFHWFKGDDKTIERMQRNGYYISVTPDILYESEIQQLVRIFPIEQLMVETDGPWPFEGPFKNHMTEPKMIHESLRVIAKLKRLNLQNTYEIVYDNTRKFFTI